jgi:hypothetical protein
MWQTAWGAPNSAATYSWSILRESRARVSLDGHEQ